MHDTHRGVNTVVVPLDGSGYAERALGPAKVLAARLGVGVGVVKAQRIVHGSVAGNIVDVSPMPVVMFGLVH